MVSKSQRQTGRDGVPSTLDKVIRALNLAKDACNVLPAQAAFGSTSALLTATRVRFRPLRDDEFPTPHCLELHGQPTRLCSPRTLLRQCM